MSYASSVLADNPTVFLQLDENAGTSAVDSGSNGAAWTYQAGVTLNQTPVFPDGGASVLSSGTAVAASLASVPAALVNPRGTSIEVSVNLPTASLKGAFAKIGTNANGWSMGVGNGNMGTNGNHLILLQDNVSTHDSGVNIGTGSHLITATISSAGALSMYIDGQLISSSVNAPAPFNAASIMSVGGSAAFLLNNTINVDNVSFYGAVLTASQVQTHWLAIQATLAATTVSLSQASLEAMTIPTATPAALSAVYVETLDTATVTPRALSNVYLESATIPTVTPRAISLAYIEVLSQSYPPQTKGWGLPITHTR